MIRRSRGSGNDLEARLDNVRNAEINRNTDMYNDIVEAEKLLKLKILHCEEIKNRSRQRE